MSKVMQLVIGRLVRTLNLAINLSDPGSDNISDLEMFISNKGSGEIDWVEAQKLISNVVNQLKSCQKEIREAEEWVQAIGEDNEQR